MSYGHNSSFNCIGNALVLLDKTDDHYHVFTNQIYLRET